MPQFVDAPCRSVNTSFVERNNGTQRRQNSRKARSTCGFSKNWAVHNAACCFAGFSYNFCWPVHNAACCFAGFSYNFCWPVRTLRAEWPDGGCQARTPAMAAGLADHVWTTEGWATYPAKPP